MKRIVNKMKKYNIQDLIIKKTASIKEAMKQLDSTATKVLFVNDNESKFVGTLSDGDIRRGLLSDCNLDSNIENVVNKNPYIVSEDHSKADTISEMKAKDIVFAPILNKDNKIINVFVLPESQKEIIIKSDFKDNVPVVIMAGGKGTRMAPFTNVLPKPLIPIGDKTIVELIIDEFMNYNLKDFFLTLNFKSEIIKAYFNSIEKPYQIDYVLEKNFFGTAGSLTLLKDKIKSAFFVSNCDILIRANIKEIYDFHKKNKSLLTIISSIQHHTLPYGVIEFRKGGKVTALKEKPEYTFPINTGVYLLEPECLEYIPENEVFHMTHLIEKLLANNLTVTTYPINESEYIDIGQWDEYRDAVRRMSL